MLHTNVSTPTVNLSMYLITYLCTFRCLGMGFDSFLVEPVQRIPRYRLLLEELLKCTAETHSDYQNIVEALTLVKMTIIYIYIYILLVHLEKRFSIVIYAILIPSLYHHDE